MESLSGIGLLHCKGEHFGLVHKVTQYQGFSVSLVCYIPLKAQESQHCQSIRFKNMASVLLPACFPVSQAKVSHISVLLNLHLSDDSSTGGPFDQEPSKQKTNPKNLRT